MTIPVDRRERSPFAGNRSLDAFAALCAAAVMARLVAPGLFGTPWLQAWSTVFVAVFLQALPFVVLGVALSAVLTVLVSPRAIARWLPSNGPAAIAVAGASGVVMPGCECGSVPMAAAMMQRGVAVGPAIAFMVSAPAINPVVLASTAVAFPGNLMVMVARLIASLSTAFALGLLWQQLARGRFKPLVRRPSVAHLSRWRAMNATVLHDLTQTGGLLVIGAAGAATVSTWVPRSWLDGLAGWGPGAVVALAVLAVVLAICSQADAFVVSSLTQFSLTAKLAFMVVGPAVDIKLIALQVGQFGRRCAAMLAISAFSVAVCAASIVGWVLL